MLDDRKTYKLALISVNIFAGQTCLDARVGLLKPSPATVKEEEEVVVVVVVGSPCHFSPLSSLN